MCTTIIDEMDGCVVRPGPAAAVPRCVHLCSCNLMILTVFAAGRPSCVGAGILHCLSSSTVPPVTRPLMRTRPVPRTIWKQLLVRTCTCGQYYFCQQKCRTIQHPATYVVHRYIRIYYYVPLGFSKYTNKLIC